MNRKKKQATTPGDNRAGIRQGIKEGFDAVILNVGPEGFAVVDQDSAFNEVAAESR